jgi:hypothetical protein
MTGASGSVMEGVAGMGVDGGARVVGGEEKEEVLDGNDGAVGGAGSGVVAVLLAGGEVARWLGEPTQSAGGPWASTGVPGRPGRRRQGGGQREGRPAATGGTMKKKRDRNVFYSSTSGYKRRVHKPWVKKFRFWQKHSPNCDFFVLHSPSTIST